MQRSLLMGSNHPSDDRIRQFMTGSIHLTEDESEHIKAWKCPECYATMQRLMAESTDPDATNTDPH